jgi:hypothetical protein
VGARDRGFARLKELRAQLQPSRVESAATPGGWSQPLYRHLHWMGWLTLRLGGKPTHEDAERDRSLVKKFEERFSAGLKDPKFIAEYEELEAAGRFAHYVR